MTIKGTFAVIFFSTTLLLQVQKIQAQKTTYLVYGGPNLSTFYSGSKSAGNFKSVTGFDFGFAAQFPAFNEFYIQPGLCFDTKGTRYSTGEKVRTVYAEIPVNLLYMPKFNNGYVIAGAGTYFALGSGGSATNKNGKDIDLIYKNDISLDEDSSGNVYLKRFDAGINLVLGYEFNSRLQLFINVQWGLLNIASRVNGEAPEHRLYNIQPAFSVGYRF